MPVLGVGLVVALLPGSGPRWGGEGGGGGRGGLPGAEILDCWHASAPAKQTASTDAWQKSVCKKEARFARSRQRTLPRPREAAVSSGSSGIWATSEISTRPNYFGGRIHSVSTPCPQAPFCVGHRGFGPSGAGKSRKHGGLVTPDHQSNVFLRTP